MQLLTKRFYLIRVGLFGLTCFILFPSGTVLAEGLAGCESTNCLKEQILGYEPLAVTEADCAALDGKKSKGFIKSDLGEICRLYDARHKVASRKLHPCHDDGSMNPDWNSRLDDLPLWLYTSEIYKQIPRELRWSDTLKKSGYNNSTVHGTYVLGLSRRTSSGRDKEKFEEENKFDVYFCQSGGFIQPQFYTPYFYMVNKKIKKAGESEWTQLGKKMVYIDQPPLADVLLIRQMPDSLKSDYKVFKLGDFNADGQSDMLFIEDAGFKKYRPGVCFYEKGKQSCRKVVADKAVSTEIFWRNADLTWQENSHIMVIISERDKQEAAEYSRYEYRDGGFVLTGTRKGEKP